MKPAYCPNDHKPGEFCPSCFQPNLVEMPVRATEETPKKKQGKLLYFPKQLTKKEKLWKYLEDRGISYFRDYIGDKVKVKMYGNLGAVSRDELIELTGVPVWYCETKGSRYPGFRLELPRYE